MAGRDELLEQDFEELTNQEKIRNNGFILLDPQHTPSSGTAPSDSASPSAPGKIIFSLGAIPLEVGFLSNRGTSIVRISEGEIVLNGSRVIAVPVDEVQEEADRRAAIAAAVAASMEEEAQAEAAIVAESQRARDGMAIGIPSTKWSLKTIAGYRVQCERSGLSSLVSKRFEDFESLHALVRRQMPLGRVDAGVPKLPRRVRALKSKEELEERRVVLETYLRELLAADSLKFYADSFVEWLTTDGAAWQVGEADADGEGVRADGDGSPSPDPATAGGSAGGSTSTATSPRTAQAKSSAPSGGSRRGPAASRKSMRAAAAPAVAAAADAGAKAKGRARAAASDAGGTLKRAAKKAEVLVETVRARMEPVDEQAEAQAVVIVTTVNNLPSEATSPYVALYLEDEDAGTTRRALSTATAKPVVNRGSDADAVPDADGFLVVPVDTVASYFEELVVNVRNVSKSTLRIALRSRRLFGFDLEFGLLKIPLDTVEVGKLVDYTVDGQSFATTPEQGAPACVKFSLLLKSTFAVSAPAEFRHVSHMGYDDDGGFDTRNLPDEWKRFFKSLGIRPREMRDPVTARMVLKIIAKHKQIREDLTVEEDDDEDEVDVDEEGGALELPPDEEVTAGDGEQQTTSGQQARLTKKKKARRKRGPDENVTAEDLLVDISFTADGGGAREDEVDGGRVSSTVIDLLDLDFNVTVGDAALTPDVMQPTQVDVLSPEAFFLPGDEEPPSSPSPTSTGDGAPTPAAPLAPPAPPALPSGAPPALPTSATTTTSTTSTNPSPAPRPAVAPPSDLLASIRTSNHTLRRASDRKLAPPKSSMPSLGSVLSLAMDKRRQAIREEREGDGGGDGVDDDDGEESDWDV